MVFSVFEDHNKCKLFKVLFSNYELFSWSLFLAMPILAINFAAFDPEGDTITYSIPEEALGSDDFTLVNYPDGFNLYFMEATVLNREVSLFNTN